MKGNLLQNLFFSFSDRKEHHLAHDMNDLRKRIGDSVFLFLTVFGLFAYIPSAILALFENLWSVFLVNSLVYITVIFLCFSKRVKPVVKGVSGSVIFYLLGVFLIAVLGSSGAGLLWLFTASLMAAFLLGHKSTRGMFILNILTLAVFYILMQKQLLPWQDDLNEDLKQWLIKSANFLMLNLIFITAHYILERSFIDLIDNAVKIRNVSTMELARQAERDETDIENHLTRMQNLVGMIARKMAQSQGLRGYITDIYIKDLIISSSLHDLGKTEIPASILLKPGPLTPQEWETVKNHPRWGGTVIENMEKNIQGRSYYTLAREIALSHHEKWDGSGYPEGLKGTDIPVSARITALADVYDALTHARPYRDALSQEDAVKIIEEGRGTHFDPDVVDAFLFCLS